MLANSFVQFPKYFEYFRTVTSFEQFDIPCRYQRNPKFVLHRDGKQSNNLH